MLLRKVYAYVKDQRICNTVKVRTAFSRLFLTAGNCTFSKLYQYNFFGESVTKLKQHLAVDKSGACIP